jgi:hypothetical protein
MAVVFRPRDRLSRPAAIVALLALAACTPPPLQASDRAGPGFGDSVNHNAAVMIVDPQPPRAQETVLPFDGHRAETAVIRYYTGQVIQPVGLTTSGLGAAPGAGQGGAATATSTGAMQ